MVTCLLLAIAAAGWPGRGFRAAPGATAPVGQGGSTPLAPKRVGRTALLVSLAAGALGMAAAVAGSAGLLATATVIATGFHLGRRALADRRRRAALADILAGLRLLSRELRAGADPAVAARHAGAAASGAGATVLTELTRLAAADDRESAADTPRSAGAGGSLGSNDDPAVQVSARLRSGWRLTRRHGLAFSPLIEALAADLAEQVAADAERSGQVAGPRMSGYVMAVLPLMGLALGVGMGADPFRVLVSSPVGNLMLVVGVALTCAGLVWSERIVRR